MNLNILLNCTCDVERYEVTRRASAVVPAWFLSHRRSASSRGSSAAAAVVAAPTQRRAVWAAGRRGRRGRWVGHRPQAKHRGGGFIFVELFGCRLEKGRKSVRCGEARRDHCFGSRYPTQSHPNSSLSKAFFGFPSHAVTHMVYVALVKFGERCWCCG